MAQSGWPTWVRYRAKRTQRQQHTRQEGRRSSDDPPAPFNASPDAAMRHGIRLCPRHDASRHVAVAVALLTVATGCTPSASRPTMPTTAISSPADGTAEPRLISGETIATGPGDTVRQVTETVRQVTEAEERAKADPWQLAILEKGEVSYADYEAAVHRMMACMRDAGIDVLGPEETSRTGLRMLHYGWSPQVDGISDEQGQLLGDDCIARYSGLIEGKYQTQPSSLEAQEQYFVKFRPAVVECIRAHGGTVRDDPAREEAMFASFPIMDNSGVDCFEKSGVSIS